MLLASMSGVDFGYSEVPCLENASLELYTGEFVAVTGSNGSSKTTLLKLALGLLEPWRGNIYLSTHNQQNEKLVIGYVPQQISAFNSGFPSTILEFVRSGTYVRGSWLRRLRTEDHLLAEQVLRQVGMWEHRNRKIGELSGGQKQRICIARALAQQPDLLVMDEPTTGMDSESRLGFYELMHHHVKVHGRTIVMVTHGLSEVESYLDRIIALERKGDGRWKCCTTTSCRGHFAPVV